MIEIYNDDCINVLNTMIENNIKIDCLLTDPPYGMKFQSNHRKIKYEYILNDDNLNWVNNYVEKINLVVKNDTGHFLFCSYHYIDIFKQALEKHFKIKNILVWEKNNTGMGDLKGNFAPKIEFIIYFTKGRKILNGRRDPNIFKFNRTNNKNHSTEKPVDLLKFLISKTTNENDLVLDTFMGSGSTGVACKESNRNFIGIELDKTYFDTSNKRINGENNEFK